MQSEQDHETAVSQRHRRVRLNEIAREPESGSSPEGAATNGVPAATATAETATEARASRVPLVERFRDFLLSHQADVRNVLIILGGWAVLMIILSPNHEYPIIDDWIYAGSVQDMLKTGAFHMPDMSQATLVGLTLWGALWARVFGFSFTVLTYSTIFWAVAALLAFYGIARQVRVPPWGALLGTAILGFNTIFVHLSYSFMTDVPFLALMLLSCFCYIRGIQTDRPAWHLAGGLFSGWSFLVRQFGGLSTIVFAVYLFVAWLQSRRAVGATTDKQQPAFRIPQAPGRMLVHLGAMVIAPILIFGFWYIWVRTPLTPTSAAAAARSAAYVFKEPWLRVFLLRAFCILPLTALFAWAAVKIKRGRRWLIAAWVLVIAFGIYWADRPGEHWIDVRGPTFVVQAGPFSYAMSNHAFSFGATGNIIRVTGIDFFQYDQARIWTEEAWRGLWLLGALLGAILLARITSSLWDWLKALGAHMRSALHDNRSALDDRSHVALYLLGLAIFVISLAFPGDLFDRYILGFLPFLILFVVRGSREWGRVAWVYSIAMLALLATFTILAKADQIDHDNARWAAGNWMMGRVGAVHVGYEWDNWQGAGSDTYQVADVLLPGFHIDQRFAYICRLCGFETRYVLAETHSDGRPQIGGLNGWNQARGVGVLPNGQVVVGDTGNSRLLLYSTDGRLQMAWAGPGVGDNLFQLISDVAVSSDGVIAVLDGGNGDIQLYKAPGQLLAHMPHTQVGIGAASGIAFAPDGTLYVADTSNGRVLHIGPQGNIIAVLNSGTNGAAPPNQPLDVAVMPDGTLYATDLDGRLVRYNAAGQAAQQWQLSGGGGTLGGSHLAVWGGTLAITNPDSNSLILFDPATGNKRAYPTSEQSPLDLQNPVGVAAGPDGRLYVLDSGHNRVVMLDGR